MSTASTRPDQTLTPSPGCDYNGAMPRVAFAGFLLAGTLASVAVAVGAQSKGGWVAKAPALLKRTEVAVAAVRGKVYVVGGFQPGLPFITPAVEEYDPAIDTWHERAPLP